MQAGALVCVLPDTTRHLVDELIVNSVVSSSEVVSGILLSGANTASVEDHEDLRAGAIFCVFTDTIKHDVDELIVNSVVSASEVAFRILLNVHSQVNICRLDGIATFF